MKRQGELAQVKREEKKAKGAKSDRLVRWRERRRCHRNRDATARVDERRRSRVVRSSVFAKISPFGARWSDDVDVGRSGALHTCSPSSVNSAAMNAI